MTTAALRAESLKIPRPRNALIRSPVVLLTGPGVLLVIMLLLGPLAILLRDSFNRFVPGELMVSAFTFENYAKFLADPYYREVLFTTIRISATSSIACLIFGFPVAYFMVRLASARLKALLMISLVLPLMMGNAVRTAAWMVILSDRGLASAIVAAVGLTDHIEIMYTETAVIIGLISVLLPFMILTLQSVLEGIDPSLEEVASSLGASHFTMIRRVVMPLALPGIMAGFLLCFTLSMNAYATPVLIGGPKFHAMAPEVYQQMQRAMNWPFGAALAYVLMFTTLLLTVGATALAQRRYRRWAE
ncbi:ABC transporter permease [Bradyrhizobium sp.]|uniref:ABC transporter permease n=1 Tax=Bradyrhizobium sp. TaxID=376 RepID=UPI003C3E8FB6